MIICSFLKDPLRYTNGCTAKSVQYIYYSYICSGEEVGVCVSVEVRGRAAGSCAAFNQHIPTGSQGQNNVKGDFVEPSFFICDTC